MKEFLLDHQISFSPSDPVFEEIKNSNHKYFQEAIKIYLESFPDNERQPVTTIKERLEKGISRLFVGIIKNEVAMMSLLFNLQESEFILLDYMAVSNKYRGAGTGSKFLEYLLNDLRAKDKFLILEVENPSYGNNKEQRKKRIEFYRRNDAVMLSDVHYLLPALDGKTPTEMNLMIMPSYSGNVIEKETVHTVILKLYKEVYGRNDNDHLLNSFINDLPEIIKLV